VKLKCYQEVEIEKNVEHIAGTDCYAFDV